MRTILHCDSTAKNSRKRQFGFGGLLLRWDPRSTASARQDTRPLYPFLALRTSHLEGGHTGSRAFDSPSSLTGENPPRHPPIWGPMPGAPDHNPQDVEWLVSQLQGALSAASGDDQEGADEDEWADPTVCGGGGYDHWHACPTTSTIPTTGMHADMHALYLLNYPPSFSVF